MLQVDTWVRTDEGEDDWVDYSHMSFHGPIVVRMEVQILDKEKHAEYRIGIDDTDTGEQKDDTSVPMSYAVALKLTGHTPKES